MATFTDAKENEWTVFIDVPTVKRLREQKLDLLGLFDDGFKAFESLVADPVKLVDTISMVCQEQIIERGMDETAFAKCLYGDALARAVDALVEGISDFFHDPKRRQAVKSVFRKAKEIEAAMLDQAALEIEAVDVAEAVKMLQTEFTAPYGNSADSSASTPA